MMEGQQPTNRGSTSASDVLLWTAPWISPSLLRAIGGFQVRFQGKDEDALPDYRIDVGKQRRDLQADDLGHLLTEPFAALGNEGLPQPPHHIDALGRLGQLPFRRRQHALQPHEEHVPHDKRPDLVGTASEKFLLELDDRRPNRGFLFPLAGHRQSDPFRYPMETGPADYSHTGSVSSSPIDSRFCGRIYRMVGRHAHPRRAGRSHVARAEAVTRNGRRNMGRARARLGPSGPAAGPFFSDFSLAFARVARIHVTQFFGGAAERP